MPDTDHYVLKRSGWLLLLIFTRFTAATFVEFAYSTFLIRDLENAPPSSQISSRDRRCESCRKSSKRKNRRWEQRAMERGIVTPLGVLMWRHQETMERVKVVMREGVLGAIMVTGAVALWKSRSVWGSAAVAAGFTVWGLFGDGLWDDDGKGD